MKLIRRDDYLLYPKHLIARTHHDETDREGIRVVDIARCLAAE